MIFIRLCSAGRTTNRGLRCVVRRNGTLPFAEMRSSSLSSRSQPREGTLVSDEVHRQGKVLRRLLLVWASLRPGDRRCLHALGSF